MEVRFLADHDLPDAVAAARFMECISSSIWDRFCAF
jgi:hypothetical protein